MLTGWIVLIDEVVLNRSERSIQFASNLDELYRDSTLAHTWTSKDNLKIAIRSCLPLIRTTLYSIAVAGSLSEIANAKKKKIIVDTF